MALKPSAVDSSPSQEFCFFFLDLDDVFIDRLSSTMGDKIQKKAEELFKKPLSFKDPFTGKQWRIAASHFLDKPAMKTIVDLILKVEKMIKVRIVMHTAWRQDCAVEDFQKEIFRDYPEVAERVIDTTPYVGSPPASSQEKETKKNAKKKYGFDFPNKGQEIKFWLLENHRFKIRNFVIIDDYDGIADLFPDNFITVDPSSLFTERDAKRAYDLLFPKPSVCDLYRNNFDKKTPQKFEVKPMSQNQIIEIFYWV